MAAEIQPSCISRFALPVTNLWKALALSLSSRLCDLSTLWSQTRHHHYMPTHLELNFMRRTAGLTYLHLSPISLLSCQKTSERENSPQLSVHPQSATPLTIPPSHKRNNDNCTDHLLCFIVSAAIRRSLVNSPTVRK